MQCSETLFWMHKLHCWSERNSECCGTGEWHLMAEMIHAGFSFQSWEEELWLLRVPHS